MDQEYEELNVSSSMQRSYVEENNADYTPENAKIPDRIILSNFIKEQTNNREKQKPVDIAQMSIRECDETEKEIAKSLVKKCDKRGVEKDMPGALKLLHQLAKVYHRKFNIRAQHYKKQAIFDCIKSAILYTAALQRASGFDKNVITTNLQIKLYSDVLQFINQNAGNRLAEKVTELKTDIHLRRKKLEHDFQGLHYPYPATYDPLERYDGHGRDKEKAFNENVKGYLNEVRLAYMEFMSKLWSDAESILGPAPCKYALMGLGSLARCEATPYSDFESIIIIEKKSKKILKYFRKLALIAFLLVIGLEETIIPAAAISSLNDVDSDNNWFFDKYSRRGISFDGFFTYASKNPLGRLSTKKNPKDFELINTSRDMLSFLNTPTMMKEDYRLSEVLKQTVFVAGDEEISNEFNKMARQKIKNQLSRNSTDFFHYLKEVLDEFDYNKLRMGKKLDVKRDVYRGISLVLPSLSILCDIHQQSSYLILECLFEKNKINQFTLHELKTALSIANYMRLEKYTVGGTQQEILPGNVNAYSKYNSCEKINVSGLIRLYLIGIEFQNQLKQIVDNQEMNASFSIQDDSRDHFLNKGNILARFQSDDLAIKCFFEYLDTISGPQDKVDVNYRIAKCRYNMGEENAALELLNKAIQNCRKSSIMHKKIVLLQALCNLKSQDNLLDLQRVLGDCRAVICKPNSYASMTTKQLLSELIVICKREKEKFELEKIDLIFILGDMELEENQFKSALPLYNEAFVISSKHRGDHDSLPDQLRSHNGKIMCYKGLKNTEDILSTCIDTMRILSHLKTNIIVRIGQKDKTAVDLSKFVCGEFIRCTKNPKPSAALKLLLLSINQMLEIFESQENDCIVSIATSTAYQAKLYLLMGDRIREGGHFKVAIAAYNLSLNICSENANEIYASIGKCHLGMNDVNTALNAYCDSLSHACDDSSKINSLNIIHQIFVQTKKKFDAVTKEVQNRVKEMVPLTLDHLCSSSISQYDGAKLCQIILHFFQHGVFEFSFSYKISILEKLIEKFIPHKVHTDILEAVLNKSKCEKTNRNKLLLLILEGQRRFKHECFLGTKAYQFVLESLFSLRMANSMAVQLSLAVKYYQDRHCERELSVGTLTEIGSKLIFDETKSDSLQAKIDFQIAYGRDLSSFKLKASFVKYKTVFSDLKNFGRQVFSEDAIDENLNNLLDSVLFSLDGFKNEPKEAVSLFLDIIEERIDFITDMKYNQKALPFLFTTMGLDDYENIEKLTTFLNIKKLSNENLMKITYRIYSLDRENTEQSLKLTWHILDGINKDKENNIAINNVVRFGLCSQCHLEYIGDLRNRLIDFFLNYKKVTFKDIIHSISKEEKDFTPENEYSEII